MKAIQVLLSVYLVICLTASSSVAEIGDVRATFSPEPPVSTNFCAAGLAFDGSFLYLNHCSSPSIYRIDPANGALLETIPFDDPAGKYIPERPAAMAYDAKRMGLWIGTQWGKGGNEFEDCGTTGMPIYFWAFNGPGLADDTVTHMFDIPLNLANPATGDLFLRSCFLNGLTYVENNIDSDADDEIWIADDRNRNIGVFRPNGGFVTGYNAQRVNVTLVNLTGLVVTTNKIYLANDGFGDVYQTVHASETTRQLMMGQLLYGGMRWEVDMECDSVTFAPDHVMWVRSSPQCNPITTTGCALKNIITAYEIEPGGCGQGAPVGACCVSAEATCSNNVTQSSCQAMQGTWTQGATCSAVPGCVAHELLLLDRTGSMKTVRSATGNTRCFDALETAKMDVDNFFNTHSTGSSLSVWTFAQTHMPNIGTHIDLIGGFITDAVTAKTALSSLDGVECLGWTPVADAICDAVDALTAAFPAAPDKARILAVSSDGGENFSTGQCSGPDSLNGSTCDNTDPFDSGSWQALVCSHIVGNSVAQVRFWGAFGGASASSSSIDLETGTAVAASVPDTTFFTALVDATGGSIVMLDDTPPSVTGPSIFGFTGACCLPDTTCQESITEAECAVLGGTHQGDASVCADATGACCLPNDTCQDAISMTACTGQGGSFQGTCTTCANDVIGACCLPDSTCQDGLTPTQCSAQSGTHQGGCSVCTGAPGECNVDVPTVSEWGLVLLTLLVVITGTVILRGRVAERSASGGAIH